MPASKTRLRLERINNLLVEVLDKSSRLLYKSRDNQPLPLSPAELQRQHDAISTSIAQLTVILVGFALFCVLTVFSKSDVSLLTADPEVTMPFGGKVSFDIFLIVGPAALIGLVSYFHAFVSYWWPAPLTPSRIEVESVD